MKLVGATAFAAFVATVWAANYAVNRWGVVPVGFGLSAPAAVYFVGLALTLRDIVHRNLGRVAVFAAILIGAVLSYLVEAGGTIPGGVIPIAAASAVAFLISETADLLVYEPTREHGWLWGQVVGKLTMTALAVAALGLIELRREVPA